MHVFINMYFVAQANEFTTDMSMYMCVYNIHEPSIIRNIHKNQKIKH